MLDLQDLIVCIAYGDDSNLLDLRLANSMDTSNSLENRVRTVMTIHKDHVVLTKLYINDERIHHIGRIVETAYAIIV